MRRILAVFLSVLVLAGNQWVGGLGQEPALAATGGATPGSYATGLYDSGFNPRTLGASDNVWNSVQQPDGKLIVVGAFTSYSGERYTSNIVRLDGTGRVDRSFNPGGSGFNGNVFALALQPDGKIIAGGDFTSYDGTSVSRVIRLNPDGSIDGTFAAMNAGANASVYAAAVAPNGSIYLTGTFTSFAGSSVGRIVRLTALGTLDTAFAAGTGFNLDMGPQALAVQADGKILVGGQFTSFNGQAASRVARINTDGSLDTAFAANAVVTGQVSALALQPDGRIFIGGDVSKVGSQTVAGLARLNATGTLDTGFNTGGAGFVGSLSVIRLDPNDASLYVGGNMTSYNGVACPRVVHLGNSGGRDTAYLTGGTPNNTATTLTLQSDGKLVVGGLFTTIAGLSANRLARLTNTGAQDASFSQLGTADPAPGTGVNAGTNVTVSLVQPDGKIVIGGSFTQYNGQAQAYLSRLNRDGTLDSAFLAGKAHLNGAVASIALQADGKLVVAGSFTKYDNQTTGPVLRLDTDGSLDSGFDASAAGFTAPATHVGLTPAGEILLAGYLRAVGTGTRLVRLTPTGGLDSGFSPVSTDAEVMDFDLQADGQIVLAGAFTTVNALAVRGVARVSSTGTLDTSFAPANLISGTARAVRVTGTGKIVVAGSFSPGIARLNADGTADSSFTAVGTGASSANVYALAVQADGKLVIGGMFTQYNGSSAPRIARLALDGSLDSSFSVQSGANSDVLGLSFDATGALLVSGGFSTVAGVAGPTGLVRLLAESYTVSYQGMRGTPGRSSDTWVVGNPSITLPGVTQPGYTSTGWYTQPSGGSFVTGGYTPSSSVGSTTLFAQWMPNTYAVSFDTQGGSSVTGSSYLTGGSITLPPAPSRSGATFNGWFTAPTGGSPLVSPYFPQNPGALILYAQWTVTSFTVSYDAQGGTASQPADVYVYGAAPLTLATASRPGYTFTGWYPTAIGGSPLTGSYTPSASITLYAHWIANTLTVSFDPQGGSAVASMPMPVGGSLTLPGAPTRAGYDFTGWYATSTGGNPLGPGTISPSNVADFTVYAQWTPHLITVSYDARGGTAVPSGSFGYGAPLYLPVTAPTRGGYTFTGWYTAPLGGTLVVDGAIPSQTANFTLYAQWTAVQYTVSFDSQGGSAVAASGFSTAGSFSLPATPPTRAGYGFTGWYLSATGGTAVSDPYTPGATGSLTLYAQWQPLSYVVTFDSQGASGVPTASYSTGGSLSLPAAPTRPGYSFTGWFTAAGASTPLSSPYSPTGQGALTLYAGWSAQSYTLWVDSQGGSSVAALSFATGTTVVLPAAPSKAGYAFAGWFAAPSGGSPLGPISMTPSPANQTIYAQWLPNSNVVSFDSQGGSSIVPASYSTGSTLTLPGAPSRAGYSFVGWAESQTGAALATPYRPSTTGAFTLYALWQPNRYLASFDSQGGSPVADQTFLTGTSLTLPGSPARPGYRFAGWFEQPQGGSALTGTTYQPQSGAAITLYAQWTAVSNTVSFDSAGGSLVASQSWATGSALSLPAAPTRAGYAFDGWFDAPSGGSALSSPYLPSQSADFTLYAHWTPASYLVFYHAQGGSAIAAGSYTTGSPIPLASGPTRAGYQFVGWSETAAGPGVLASPYLPAAAGPVDLYAQWVAVPNTVAFDAQGGSALAAQTFATGASISLPPGPTRSGYSFAGWFDAAVGGTLLGPVSFTPPGTGSITLYAQWTPNQNQVVYHVQGGSSVPNGSFLTGGALSLANPPTRAGYQWAGWFSQPSGGSALPQTYLPAATTGIDLFAQWIPLSYAVTFDSQGGSPVPSSSVASAGSIVLPAAPTRAGYRFTGWYDALAASTPLSSPYAPSISNPLTLYAGWAANGYVVHFDTQGGSPVTDVGFSTGASISLPALPIRPGYTAVGWFETASGGSAVTSTYTPAQASDITLYTQWRATLNQVSFDSQGGSALAPSSFSTGGNLTLPALPSRVGYSCTGWFLTASGGSALPNPYTPSATSALTLYAQWTPIDYLISFDAQGGGATGPIRYSTGIAISLPTAPIRAGYTFTGWFTSPGAPTALLSPYLPAQPGALTLYAGWSADLQQLSFDSQGGSPVAAVGYLTGSSVTLPAPPTRPGYRCEGWFSQQTGGSALSASVTPATLGATLYAQWTALGHQLTFDSQGGGSVTGIRFDTDATVAMPSGPARAGYRFTGWYLSPGTGSALPASYRPTVASDLTVYAGWSANDYLVSFDAQGGSAVAPDRYATGAVVPQPAAPSRPGYTFIGWGLSAAGPALPGGYQPPTPTNLTLYALWTADSYPVNYDSTGGSPVPAASYLTGSGLTLAAAPIRVGYQFTGWSLAPSGGNTVPAGYVPGGSGPLTLYATWQPIALTVSYDSQGGSTLPAGNVSTGGVLTLPGLPTRTGYHCEGWFTAPSGGIALPPRYSPSNTADFTLYAQWTATRNPISFDPTGGSPVPTSSYLTGGAINLPSLPTRAGYQATGWFTAPTGGSPISDPYAPSGSGPLTVYAQWAANSYALSFDSQGGTALAATSFTTGASVALPNAPTRPGYQFAGWFEQPLGGAPVSSPYAPPTTAPLTLYAQWSPVPNRAQFNTQGGNPIAAMRFVTGSPLTLPGAPSRAGYAFTGWYLTPSGGTALPTSYLATGSGDLTVYAQWVPNNYVVSYLSQGGSAVVAGSYLTGGSIDLPLPPTRVGYSFTGWHTVPSGGSALPSRYLPPGYGPLTLYAQWQADTYSIVFDTQGGKAVSPVSYTTGSAVSLPSGPERDGYSFAGWFEGPTGGSPVPNPYRAAATSAITLYAHWVPADQTAGGSSSGAGDGGRGGSGQASATGTVNALTGWWQQVPLGVALLLLALAVYRQRRQLHKAVAERDEPHRMRVTLGPRRARHGLS